MRMILSFFLFSLLFCNVSLASTPRVLFDQGHRQAFTIEKSGPLQLSQFAAKFRNSGWKVDSTDTLITPQTLTGVNALVISGAFQPLQKSEIEAVKGFVEHGGNLVVMLHIAPPLIPLLDTLGVASANGVVREHEKKQVINDQPLNFKTTTLKEHPLTKGLSHLSLYGSWPLLPLRDGVQIIASTSPTAWVDLNRDDTLSAKDAVQEFGLVVAGTMGKGQFAIFADDAMFQNNYFQGENEKLVGNMSRWMNQK